MMYLLLAVGFFLLVRGADFFVEGASSVASRLKVPTVVIGLTIVAMGTSAPEAAVSITAGLAGNSDISLGNVIGSNLFNLLMVIGICAVIHPVPSHKDILKRDLIWNIGITCLLFLFILDHRISRVEGILLFLCLIIYLFLVVKNALANRVESQSLKILPLGKCIIFIIFGLAAIILGGNLVVDNASLIAKSLGMSDTLVGLTIVAIGTSLPELVTSITASRKGDSGMAIGNAVGSDLFNIMFILSSASILTPITVAPELLIDTILLIGACVLIYFFGKSGNRTSRAEGAVCIACYIAYTAYIIIR